MARDKRARNTRDVGREKLLEAARFLFRTNTKHEISRQDIARQAGVAPALMTYYFGSNRDLILAATHPILDEAISKLLAAIDSSDSYDTRFHRVIEHFLAFAHHNALLLDIFVEAAIESGDQAAQGLIGSTLERLARFFNGAVEAGVIAKETNPRFLLLALWGMCRLVGGVQPFPLQLFDPALQASDAPKAQADLILKLVMHGVGSGNNR